MIITDTMEGGESNMSEKQEQVINTFPNCPVKIWTIFLDLAKVWLLS